MKAHPKKSRREKKSKFERLIPVVMVLWLAAMGGYVYFFVLGKLPETGPLEAFVHVHVKFQVIVDGNNLTTAIPAGIGQVPELWQNHTLDSYGQQGMSPIHTEDSDGIIHVTLYRGDAKLANGFVLKDFFNIWGNELTTNCIEIDKQYCTDNYNISTFIDDPDQPDPRTVRGPDPSARLKGKVDLAETTLIRVNIASLSSTT